MSPQATIRAQARTALQGHYVQAVVATATSLLPVLLIDTASVLLVCWFRFFGADNSMMQTLTYAIVTPVTLLLGVLLSPFVNGYIRMFYRCALSGEMDLKDFYYYFEKGRFSRTLHLNVSYLLRVILFYAPVVAYEIVSAVIPNDFYGTVLYNDLCFALIVLSGVALILYSLRYFTLFTLYVEREDMRIRELYRASRRIMRGRWFDAAKLIFSYTPWMLLCLTVLPVLYVAPYMTQGLCIGAKWMTRASEETT